jgi:U3 small nucleolar RNA-associated protein 5
VVQLSACQYANDAQLPNLVTRLSSLHATLTSRLALQERLLLLNGRLDLALAQVELRWSKSPGVSSNSEGKKGTKDEEDNVTRYIEGDSEEDEEMQVEIDKDSDEGSVEEIGLKGTSDADTTEEESDEDEDDEDLPDDEDESDSEEEEEEEEEEDSDVSEDGPRVNGFVDDEAEEWSGSEEEDDDE